MNDGKRSPDRTAEKWRVALALLVALISFVALALVAFVTSTFVGVELFPEENPFFAIGAYLFYGLVGLVIFIYPIFVVSRRVFRKIIKSGVTNVE